MPVRSRVYSIKTPEALHARPAAKILNAAKTHGCRLLMKKDGGWAEAGIMNLLLQGAENGETVELAVENGQEEQCLEEIRKVLEG